MQVTYEIVSTPERMAEIAPAWGSLWQRCGGELFQSHEWLSAWWNAEHAQRLRIGCAWQGDRLIAVLPLCIRRWNGIRVLQWAAQPFSDYCDALSQAPLGVLEALWARTTRRGGFDIVRLKHVRANAAIRPLLGLLGMAEERVEVCLQVAGEWPDGAAWFRNLNKKTRNNHTRGKRILSESGDIVIRQIGDDESRETVIRRLLQLKRLWRTNRGSPLVRNDNTLLALAHALDRLGSLRIYVIECDGNIIAGSVNAVHGDRMLALFATYDPAHHSAGPGIILMTEYTQTAFDEGLTEIDYLLGCESYKFKFANRRSEIYIFVRGYTLVGRLALAGYRWLQRRRPAEPAPSIGSAYLTDKGTPRNAAKPKTAKHELAT